ncbi:MAG: bifunctional diaminohydroxyphosphoribosylaminopyrimidine deaminase/5-amino-6-(5-phosphoribosylamino)uracil reductase RibD [Gemmatimonadales bacterium]
MSRALSLAWRGWGRVHPNPLVGAVVLRDGDLVGEGWHAEFGREHAEVVALRSAGARARGATLVVTLEPCAHQGKQPPCTEAILASGITRVVAALPDPNPVAAGGAPLLRARGVDVQLGVLEAEACRQNALFRHQFSGASRPFVALKLATSLDGRIADAAGRSRWISGPQARDFAHWLRAGFDALAVGGETARIDDPALTVRGSVVPRIAPRRVIFDRGLDLHERLQLLQTASDPRTIVLAAPAAVRERGTEAQYRGVTVVGAESLAKGMRWLREQEGVLSVLVEGGGRLAGALLGAGLVDRLYWIQSPLWLGTGAIPAFAELPDLALGAAPRWQVAERRALGEDTLLVVDREPCSPV